uniref:rRNA N-glycosylase n=1 Tax=Oryza barthii TaxID=65489 RepID=A0A0D3HD43_9ORYZ
MMHAYANASSLISQSNPLMSNPRNLSMKMMLAGVPSLNNDDHRRRGHGRSDLITVKVMAILLLLISTPAHSIGGVVDDDDDVEYVEITCYIDTQPFDYCFEQAYLLLSDNEPRKTVHGNHPVLAPKRKGQDTFTAPSRKWLKMHLVGRKPRIDRCTIALRFDTIYLMAFSTNQNQWYSMYSGFPIAHTRLPFDEDYFALAGGTSNLVTVPLGKESALDAIHTLATFDGESANDLKIPLVKLRIMFSEALKLKPVRLAFSRDWNEETHITKQDANYIGCWGLMSFNLVAWKNSGYAYWKSEKKLENCLVNTPWNASEVGDLLMRPNDEAI